MSQADPGDHVRRQLRTLQRVVGGPTDGVLARRSGVSAATFSEVMSGKRRPRAEFVAKVVSGCLVSARMNGHAPLDVRRVLHALRLPDHTAADAGILERDDDLSRCSAVLDAVRSRVGATVVVEGPAGIGKSEVVAQVCAEAAVRGIVPLAVRGNHRDRTMAFGAARTLLARWVTGHPARDQRALFAGAAEFARVPLGVPRPGRHNPASVIGLTEALYWLVVNATSLVGEGREDEGLLLAVDDAHWLDEESLSWLEFLGDRLTGLPVVVLLAYRPHESHAAALARIALRAEEVIRPRPLGPDAVRTIISRGLPSRQAVDERFCAAFLERSGGNPFYLRWMLDVARERGLKPTASDVEAVGTLTPRNVVMYLNERLGGLGPDARRLAQAIAVLGPGSPLGDAARLADLAPEEAKLQYDRLCNAAILSPAPTSDFHHPIIRSAVYDDMDPSLRSDVHLEAARLLHDRHAASEAVAAHLLHVHADADPWVVDRLDEAASEAWASGLSTTAARYLHRAVDEPPPPDQRGRVRLRYGQALALGPVAAALPELLAAYREAPDDALRTEAAIALAKTHGYAHQLGESVRMLDTAIDLCADEGLRRQALAEQLLWAAWWADDPLRADRTYLLDRIVPPLTGDTYVERLLIALHAWSLVLRGRPRTEALTAVHRVIRRGLVFADVDKGMEVATITAFIHMYSGEAVVAHGLLEQAIEEFERDGWRGTHLAFAYANRGRSALMCGRLSDAVADADIALRLARRSGDGTPAEWFATGALVEALVARGDISRAATVSACGGYREQRPDAVILPVPQAVLGTLLLAQGHRDQAAATLRDVGRRLDAAPMTNPAVCPWRFELARALRHSAPREAREIAATAQEQADLLDDPTTRGRALRVLAAVNPSTEHLEESARLLRDSADRWQYLQTVTDLGRALARSGHTADARRAFTEALALADECGAIALREDIARRLAVTGANADHPRPANALSPRLRRVAELSAEGLSEAEIAHKVVLSLETVRTLVHEAHARMNTTSRAELRQALAR
ncbi:DNA-binding NarL/FixJ family response regulator [Saccharothrix ecbatanensis]|uniref:DNA-binding NarL/FixJ family response regulator n=1 Tax=Saccharothrix ecbatanensis TaxID=1105145 RepID=A0A7W9HK39_9PSEU|nr:AAA family ATPase [Saccharothrix ecbatanensis]MBB5803670.1 DNA-binding NarL/FixJ family response regulator [Saccharothrix ecbatanensis]